MKKLLILGLMSAISLNVLAMDFNSIIQENSKAQNSLHSEIQKTISDSQIAAQAYEKKYIADEKEVIHNKVSKEFLTAAKEKKQYRASDKVTEKRLAQEFNDLE